MLATVSELAVARQEILANNPAGIILQEVIYHIIIVLQVSWRCLWLGAFALLPLFLQRVIASLRPTSNHLVHRQVHRSIVLVVLTVIAHIFVVANELRVVATQRSWQTTVKFYLRRQIIQHIKVIASYLLLQLWVGGQLAERISEHTWVML